METTNIKSINNLISDNKFIKEILKANSSDEVKKIFSEKGFDISDEQIEIMKKTIYDEFIKLSKIPDKEIEQIAGGLNTEEVKYALQSGAGYGGAYGMWIGAGLGSVAGVIDSVIKATASKIDSPQSFIKNTLKTALYTSGAGGLIGAGLGGISGASYDIGSQGDKGLKSITDKSQ